MEVIDHIRGRIVGYDEKTGEIHLNRNAKRPIEWILKHEVTHSGEKTKAYDNFVKKIVKTEVYAEWLRGRTGVDASVDVMEAMLGDEVRKIYAEKGVELGKKQGKITEARQEIIADFIGDMLFNCFNICNIFLKRVVLIIKGLL